MRLSLRIDRKLWRPLMEYSLPLMIAGLPGVMNDFLDRILIDSSMPIPLPGGRIWVYIAGVKIAVIMSLFIQMFRYAAEPFFFKTKREWQQEGLCRCDALVRSLLYVRFVAIMLFMDEIASYSARISEWVSQLPR